MAFKAPTPVPSCRAMDERTCPASSFSPFDLAALENIRGKGFEDAFLPQFQSHLNA